MRFGQFLLRDRASNTVGFALVAPILVASFLALAQIANLANVQVTLATAARSAAREGSRYDGSIADAVRQANKVLSAQGIQDGTLVQVESTSLSGNQVTQVKITKKYRISWLNYDLVLISTGQSVDEKNL